MNIKSFLNKQIAFSFSMKSRLSIGLISGTFLSFIIIFLQPFNSNEFESDHKFVFFLGFGIVLLLAYLFYTYVEVLFYKNKNQLWLVKYEILSLLLFFTLLGYSLYVYNYKFINGDELSLMSLVFYATNIVLVFIPIFLPLFIFLRKQFGERMTPLNHNVIHLKGSNKDEVLNIDKSKLIYIKASENYVEVYYASDNKIQHVLFRNTLSNTHKQLPFLEKSHRSYLVNVPTIKTVKGNSQSAVILFDYPNIEIPLSKTYYQKIKNLVSN